MALPRIVLEKAPTGLDVLFEEISKYASPEYQNMIRENERADARLELSQNQYKESVEQNKLTRLREQEQDQLARDKFGLQEKQYELDSFKDAYNTTKAEIDANIAFSYPDSQSLANMDVDAVLAQINTGNPEHDNKIKPRLRKNLQAKKDFALRQESLATDFKDRYNARNPNLAYSMDMDDARMFMKDPKSYQSYLYSNYIKDRNNITDDDKSALSYYTNRLASLETKRNKLAEQFALMPEDDEAYETTKAQLETFDKNISNFEAQASKIIAKGQGGGGGDLSDAFITTKENGIDEQVNILAKRDELIRRGLGAPPTLSDDGSYDLAFGSDNEADQVIADNAIDTATKNIAEDNVDDVAFANNYTDPTELRRVTEQDQAMEYSKNSIQEAIDAGEIKDKADAKSLGISDKIIAGLNFAQAGDTSKRRDSADEELFPDTGQSLTSGNILEVKSGSSKGKKFNVEVLTSRMANELKRIDNLKERYNKTAPSNKKTILARTLSGRQQEIKDILNPYLSSSGDFRDKEYNSKFYEMLSKKTNIPVNELKQILMSNMEFNI
tara:strand:- start:2906 stop:4573 length:1668 start_codon:yes stop_codon:yes gene_type:complete